MWYSVGDDGVTMIHGSGDFWSKSNRGVSMGHDMYSLVSRGGKRGARIVVEGALVGKDRGRLR